MAPIKHLTLKFTGILPSPVIYDQIYWNKGGGRKHMFQCTSNTKPSRVSTFDTKQDIHD